MAALPSAPALGYSFSPTADFPGVQLDAEFNRTNAAVGVLIDYVQVALNADGTLKTGTVTYDHIVAPDFRFSGRGTACKQSSAVSRYEPFKQSCRLGRLHHQTIMKASGACYASKPAFSNFRICRESQ
jgi:hypothetical protein